jgi:hypothetical protein
MMSLDILDYWKIYQQEFFYNVEHVQDHLIYTVISNKFACHHNYAMETNCWNRSWSIGFPLDLMMMTT